MGLQLSGSVQLEGNLLVTGSANSVFENISVTNRITANEINVQFVSSSIIYSSGSNRFGDEAGDKHQFTGSVDIKGVGVISGSLGIGVTPVEYSSFDSNTLQVKRAILSSDNTTNGLRLSHNVNYSANNFRFIASGIPTTVYQQFAGNHYFYTSPAGTAGNSIGNFTASLTLSNTGAATFANSVTAGSGLINGTTDAFFDLNRSASGNASRVRFQTTGTDEFEIGLKGGVPGFHITSGDATELLTISGSNVGIGIIPNTWTGTNVKSLQIYLGSLSTSLTWGTALAHNAYYNGSWRYTGTFNAGKYDIGGNEHIWYSAPSGTAGDVISFVETMKLDSSSRLGINYNNSAIHTYGSSAYSAQLTVKTTSASALTLLNSTTGGDAQVAINFVNEFDSGQYNYIARIIAEPEGSWTSTASTRDSRLSFFTTLNGVTNDAMSISSAGQIMLGSASTGASGLAVMYYGGGFANQTTLDTDTRFQGPNTSVAAAKCYAWNTYSDQRIKKEINPLTYGLSKILQLNPVSYNQYDSEIIGDEIVLKETYKSTIGLIAQEVNDLIPEAVGVGNDTELWGLDYDKIIPVLIKAIQEQQTQIEELKSRVEQLQNN
jgi:hypothetical protein